MISGAINMAFDQELELMPACWKEKTRSTEAAITRMAPKKSSSLSGRSRIGGSMSGDGHAMMKTRRGTIPIGALKSQQNGIYLEVDSLQDG